MQIWLRHATRATCIHYAIHTPCAAPSKRSPSGATTGIYCSHHWPGAPSGLAARDFAGNASRTTREATSSLLFAGQHEERLSALGCAASRRCWRCNCQARAGPRPLAVRSAVEAASISRDSSAPHGVTPSYTVASRLREDTVRVSRRRSGSQARPPAKPEAPQPRGFDAGAAAQRPTSSSGHPQGRGAPGSG